MDLAQKHCVPCEEGGPALPKEEEEKLLKNVQDWQLMTDDTHSASSGQVHKLRRQFTFKDFKGSIAFVNKVADIAEAEQHHPDIYIFYNKVQLDLYTHAVGGLSENDFILAAKIDTISK